MHSYSVKAIIVTSGVRDEHREVGLYFGDVQCRAFGDGLHKLFSSQIRSVLSSGEQNAVLGWMVRMTVEERREKTEERRTEQSRPVRDENSTWQHMNHRVLTPVQQRCYTVNQHVVHCSYFTSRHHWPLCFPSSAKTVSCFAVLPHHKYLVPKIFSRRRHDGSTMAARQPPNPESTNFQRNYLNNQTSVHHD